MPSSSSSSRRRSSHGRYDHRDESFQGPIDSILYMLTGACSTMYHLISTTTSTSRTNPQHWDSDDDIEEDDGTLLTETTSYSSSDRPSKNSGSRRRRRKSVQGTTSHVPPPRSRSHSVQAGMRRSSPPPVSFGVKTDNGGRGKYRSRSLSKSHFGRRSEEELRMGSSRSATTKQVLRENTEIHIKQSDQEDDISAISAGTLEHMEKMFILQEANKTLLLNKQHQQQQQQVQQQVQKQEQLQQRPQETAFDNGSSKHDVGLVDSSPTAANVLPSTHDGSFHNKENLHMHGSYATSPDRSCTSRKSQLSSHAVLSMASSTGTSEFESIWHRPIQRLQQQPQLSQQQQMMKFQTQGQEQVKCSMDSSLYRQKLDHHGNHHHDRLDVDDNPIGMASEAFLLHEKKKKKNGSSSRSKSAMLYETPNTRKMKRRIQMDWIGTIDEGIYSDEEEI